MIGSTETWPPPPFSLLPRNAAFPEEARTAEESLAPDLAPNEQANVRRHDAVRVHLDPLGPPVQEGERIPSRSHPDAQVLEGRVRLGREDRAAHGGLA